MNYSETVEAGNDLMAWCNGNSVEIIESLAILLFIIAIILKFRKK